MAEYTTIKVSRSIKEKLEAYARTRGLSLAAAVNQLLEEQRVLEELAEIKRLLEEQNRLLAEIRELLRSGQPSVLSEAPGEPELPSWVRDNPWLKILENKR